MLALVSEYAARPVIGGVFIGLLAAFWVSRIVAGFVSGARTVDSLVPAATVAVILLVAAVAEDTRMLMRRQIIDHQMQIEVRGRLLVDLPQKLEEFLMPMAIHARADDRPREDVQRGKQRRGPVPAVVMRVRARASAFQRQARLGALQRLNLRLLVDAEHQRFLRRVQIQPDDVNQLLDKFAGLSRA